MIKVPKFLIKMLMPLMSILTPTCEVVSQKISQSMDHPISLVGRLRVRIHLIGCELCARYERQLLAMHKMLESRSEELYEQDTGAKLSDEARQRIKREIHRNKPQ